MTLLKKLLLLIILPLSFLTCEFVDGDYSNVIKIYSGGFGYEIAYRVDDNKVYSGSNSYTVAYRIDENRIYSGAFGYDVAYRIDK